MALQALSFRPAFSALRDRLRLQSKSGEPLLPPEVAFACVVAATICFGWLNIKFAFKMIGATKDFALFYGAARAFLDGGEMYYGLANLNPPHLHLLLLPIARLPLGTAWTIWIFAGLAGLVLSIRAIFRELQFEVTPWRALVTVAAVISTEATVSHWINGQVSWVLMVPLTWAWIFARRGRWVAAGALLGAVITVKPFLLVFVPYLVLARRGRALAALTISAAATLALGLAVFGIDRYATWLRVLGTVEWLFLPVNASVMGFFTRSFTVNWFAPIVNAPWIVRPAWLILSAIIGLATLVVARRTGTAESVDRGFALVILCALLTSPLGWLYYIWLGLGPLFACVLRRWRTGSRAPLIVAAIGLYMPTLGTMALQPFPPATLLFGSSYFWGLSIVWAMLIREGLNVLSRRAATVAPARGPAGLEPA
jgi:arabinofuranan 3-O-arabinosyltransferase